MTKSKAAPRERIYALDILRGGAMILVMLYHLLYDLKFIFGADIPRAVTPGAPETEAVHICFLWVLFAVSGICMGYSRDPVKRGAFLYIIGFLITLGTSYFMPSELIVFGVLSCFGACMVICGLIKPLLDRLPWQGLLAGAVLLWLMFMDFHKGASGGRIHLLFADLVIPLPAAGEYAYPIGIKSRAFVSADYFPVVPFIFIFLSGYALHAPVKERRLPKGFYELRCPPLEFIGRHSLIIYAVHQPLMLAALSVIL